jgi:hypothetical protein
MEFNFLRGFKYPPTIWRVLILVSHDDSRDTLQVCWADEFDHHRRLIFFTEENIILGEFFHRYFNSGFKFVISEINVLDEEDYPARGRDFRGAWDKLVDITYAAYVEEN